MERTREERCGPVTPHGSRSPSTLLARWGEVLAERPDEVAIHDDTEEVPFRELGERVARVAGGLAARGLAGERVAVLVTQGAPWLEAFLGIVTSGGVAVPLSPIHPDAERRWFVETSRARGVVTCREQAPLARACAGGAPVLHVEDLRRAGCAAPAPSADDDVAFLLYTSGTTGKPKGALSTHGNLAATARLVGRAWRWSATDRLVHALPLHHLHGLGISLFVSLLAGSATRMLARFDAARTWDALCGATVLMGVPTMHRKLLDALDAADPATQALWRASAAGLRLVTSGSAALPTTVGERWRQLTGAYPLERFGMTEIGVGASNPVDGERVPGSCGPVLPGMELRIVADGGREVAPGEPGEIWIRGPSVFPGYDANDAATLEAFTDGWFRSGDTATWLEGGYLKILGRTSVDILKSGGYKLSALEIEELLREHPGVADVAVVGVPDDTWGELAIACVIPRLPAAVGVDEAALRAWAKERVAPYKVPKRVFVVAELPRNPVGKVVKPELARWVREQLSSG